MMKSGAANKEAGMEQAGIQMLNLADLRPMENYRKSMDPKKLAELTESVRTKGVVQPILVRPNGKGYEIVFGQRRWMASKQAGLQTIPAMIRKVTDGEALELQVIENSQREDPNPMEEAFGYKKLLDMGKHTTETLSAKLDRSSQYVEGRMRLLRLPKEVQDRLIDGSIPVSHALMLTRLKNDGDMKKLAKEIISEEMSLGDMRRSLREYSTEMSRAIFDTTACGSCAARSKAQVGLFPDAKQDGDSCMDRSCFFTKTKHHYGVEAAALRNMGVKIYSREQDFDAALKKAGRTATEIATNSQDSHSQKPFPSKWKSQCSKCEKRAFVYFEQKTWQGMVLKAQWACLEKKCLDKMNSTKSSPAGKRNEQDHTPARTSSPEHARSCRDRFVYREIPPKVEKSQTLQLRLAIYHLLEHFEELHGGLPGDTKDADKSRAALFQELTGRKLGSNKYSMMSYFTSEDYAAIAAIPEKRLLETLLRIVRTSVPFTESEVLLLMLPEAGIDLDKSRLVDKAYLESKTKAELVKLAKEMKLPAAKTIHDGMSKPAVVELLASQDLTGKLPKDIADYCELKTLAKMAGGKGKA